MKKSVAVKQLSKTEKVKKVNTAIVVKAFEDKAKPLIKKLDNLAIISTQEDYEKAGLYLKELKEIGKLADEEKDKFIVPLKQLIKTTNEFFKPFEELRDKK